VIVSGGCCCTIDYLTNLLRIADLEKKQGGMHKQLDGIIGFMRNFVFDDSHIL